MEGVSGAVFKGFPTREEAEAYAGVQMAFTEMEELVEDSMPEVKKPGTAIAYVDGSYNNDTGEYSCGVVFLTDTDELHIARKGESEELAAMRNVAGEILGAELAMKQAVELGIRKLSIYHDYEGIASWCLGKWKTNKEGTKAYKAYFDSIRDKMEIEFVKVKGHSGDKYNDLADELAKSVIFNE